jgi:hypothetical protein
MAIPPISCTLLRTRGGQLSGGHFSGGMRRGEHEADGRETRTPREQRLNRRSAETRTVRPASRLVPEIPAAK